MLGGIKKGEKQGTQSIENFSAWAPALEELEKFRARSPFYSNACYKT